MASVRSVQSVAGAALVGLVAGGLRDPVEARAAAARAAAGALGADEAYVFAAAGEVLSPESVAAACAVFGVAEAEGLWGADPPNRAALEPVMRILALALRDLAADAALSVETRLRVRGTVVSLFSRLFRLPTAELERHFAEA